MRHVTHAARAGAVKSFRAEASVAGVKHRYIYGVKYEPDVSCVHGEPALCGARPAALFPGNSLRYIHI